MCRILQSSVDLQTIDHATVTNLTTRRTIWLLITEVCYCLQTFPKVQIRSYQRQYGNLSGLKWAKWKMSFWANLLIGIMIEITNSYQQFVLKHFIHMIFTGTKEKGEFSAWISRNRKKNNPNHFQTKRSRKFLVDTNKVHGLIYPTQRLLLGW